MADKPALVPLGLVMDELIALAMAEGGMSRRNAIRFVRKAVERQWKSGKLDLYGTPAGIEEVKGGGEHPAE